MSVACCSSGGYGVCSLPSQVMVGVLCEVYLDILYSPVSLTPESVASTSGGAGNNRLIAGSE